MSMTPTTPATFYDFNEEVVSIPVVTLLALYVAFKAHVNHGIDPTDGGIKERVYDLLSCPADYPEEDVLWHLSMVREQTLEHYGRDV